MRNLLPLFCLLVCGSCGEDEKSTDSTTPLEFTLSTEIVRNRSAVADSYLDVDDCGVFCYYDPFCDPIIEDLYLERLPRGWSHSCPLVWEDINGQETTFVAYSPYATAQNGIEIVADSVYFSLSYQVPAQAADHPYIMVSYPEVVQEANASSVLFIMQHPLCVVTLLASDTQIESLAIVDVPTSGVLHLAADGSLAWEVDLDTLGEVEITAGDSAMMLPCELCSTALVRVTLSDGQISVISLEGDSWAQNERVDYTIAVDSTDSVTLHREPAL